MTRRKTALYRDTQIWFFAGLALLAVVFILYMYFVSSSVVHVVMRKEIDRDIIELGARVSQLEAKYVTIQHSISGDIASLDGFVAVEHKTFVDRSPSSLVLSAAAR